MHNSGTDADKLNSSSKESSEYNSFSSSVSRRENHNNKYISKDLDKLIRLCIIIETAVGMKQLRVEKVLDLVEGLLKIKTELDREIEKYETDYKFISSKGVGLSLDEFRQKCFVSYIIANMIHDRSYIKNEIVKFKSEANKLNLEMIEHEKIYKAIVHKNENILKYLNNRKQLDDI